jgi:hypothetical protein
VQVSCNVFMVDSYQLAGVQRLSYWLPVAHQ